MINRVTIASLALKQLQKVPKHIQVKFFNWQMAVLESGLEAVRKIPGYHDEHLKGERKGQRSIRLNKAYRAIYVIKSDSVAEIVSVEEIHKHEY
jgi:proteic killer suppression protein